MENKIIQAKEDSNEVKENQTMEEVWEEFVMSLPPNKYVWISLAPKKLGLIKLSTSKIPVTSTPRPAKASGKENARKKSRQEESVTNNEEDVVGMTKIRADARAMGVKEELSDDLFGGHSYFFD